MKKPGNLFAKVQMWKKHRKVKNFKKRIVTQKFTLGKFSVPAWANQPPGFSVRGTSTPNGLFQTIKILMGYTKRLHQLKHGVLFHLKFENLELFVNCLNQLFLIFQVFENFAIYHYINGGFTLILTSFKLFLFFHFQCLSRYMCGHNLTVTFPLDFHSYTGRNALVNSLY